MRAIIEDGTSLAAARTTLTRLTRQLGRPLPEESGSGSDWRLFPTKADLANANLVAAGVAPARARAVSRLVRGLCDGSIDLDTLRAHDEVVSELRERAGFQPRTAEYVALRALGDPDAFPARDSRLDQRAEAWRPWRAYAAMHLWVADAAPVIRRAPSVDGTSDVFVAG